MKNIIKSTLALAGLFFVLAVASVQAQIPTKTIASVPFDFTAGKSNLKAGTYSIRRTNGMALAIQNDEGKTVAVVNAPLTLGSRDFKAGERLVFNRYGNDYFLSQVWLSVDSGRQLYQSTKEVRIAREFKLASNGAKPERVEVAIR
ncbi:MAG: hypothetical protein C5B55_07690 [Blastocatellia bacterium]|nr:MAG: hypothetical protein C5B55_07690 [Blastocatellia bacterium]